MFVQHVNVRLRMGLFPFRITNVERIFEVFFYNYLNERPYSDDSDKVVLFTPMTPIIYSDKHKKTGVPSDTSVY